MQSYAYDNAATAATYTTPKEARTAMSPKVRWIGASFLSQLPQLLRILSLHQADVARAAGVHEATLSRALHGRQRLSAPTIRRLEAAITQLVGASA
jgi:hypothetical protein